MGLGQAERDRQGIRSAWSSRDLAASDAGAEDPSLDVQKRVVRPLALQSRLSRPPMVVRPVGLSLAIINQSQRMMFRSELCTFSPPLYSMSPSLRNLFMNELTRERVVPTIFASVS